MPSSPPGETFTILEVTDYRQDGPALGPPHCPVRPAAPASSRDTWDPGCVLARTA